MKCKITDTPNSEYVNDKQTCIEMEQKSGSKTDSVQQYTQNDNLRFMQISKSEDENVSDEVLNISKNKLGIILPKS